MTGRRALGEVVLFVLAASAGTVGIGELYRGHVAWLVVTAFAVFVLARQMGRVQDTWPHRNRPRRQSAGPRSSGVALASAGKDTGPAGKDTGPGSQMDYQMTSGAVGRTSGPAERDGEMTR